METRSLTRGESYSELGYVSGIPVRNLWLLLLYASELYRHIKDRKKVALEENPDDIPDLVAEVLVHVVQKRLSRNLSFGYQSIDAVLGRVRGRIDLLNTERRQLMARGLVACQFDDLTVNTPRNRYVRAALNSISRIVRRPDIKHQCRSLAFKLEQIGVTGERPDKTILSLDRFGRHDLEDKHMMAAAKLAFDLSLPTESVGTQSLPLPDRDIQRVRHLFEKAVGGFYDVTLSSKGWRIETGQIINWQVKEKSPGIDKILPSMRTDIILEHYAQGRRIVIDTKFTSIVTKGWHREKTLRSGYLYQIYTYLRSQECVDDPLSQKATGLLLHPSTDEMIDEKAVIQGHAIRFATVDLAASAMEIRNQLLRVVDS